MNLTTTKKPSGRLPKRITINTLAIPSKDKRTKILQIRQANITVQTMQHNLKNKCKKLRTPLEFKKRKQLGHVD